MAVRRRRSRKRSPLRRRAWHSSRSSVRSPRLASGNSGRPLVAVRAGWSQADKSSLAAAADALTPTEKVPLFRALFRGREDVFPTRFVAKRTGQAGYAPACRNKFDEGVCRLPMIKCGECTNQAFVPVDDATIVAHVKGRHVMGVYPMMPRRHLLVLRRRLRQDHLERGCRRIPGDVSTDRPASRSRAIEVGQWRARLVLLCCAGSRRHSSHDGIVSDH